MKTYDIFNFIENLLLKEGFNDIREVNILTIEKSIRTYLIYKTKTKDETLSNEELLEKIKELIPEELQDREMSNFTFYLLWYLSIIQEWEILWEIEDTKEPYMKEIEINKIDSLVTKKDYDSIKTFTFVLEAIKKIQDKRELIK